VLPFSNKAGVRKGGIGLTAVSDKAGQVVYVQNTGVHLSMAYNASLGKELSMAFGLNAGFNQRRLSMDGALTESQYAGATGLNTGLSNGEEGNNFSKGYFDVGTGMLLYADNVMQRRKYYLGLSAYHLTRPRTELGTTKE
jgi:type IX secretion system PorP/SprF family membrane protein